MRKNKGSASTTVTEAPEVVAPEVVTEVVEVTDEAKRAEFDALQARKQALLDELAEVEGTLSAQYRNWYLLSSVVAKPVALCREVFITMAAEVCGVPQRKLVLDKCTSKGISPNTAKTQYQINKQRYERGDFADAIGAIHDDEAGLVTDDEGVVVE